LEVCGNFEIFHIKKHASEFLGVRRFFTSIVGMKKKEVARIIGNGDRISFID
jgi:hypothetical protein